METSLWWEEEGSIFSSALFWLLLCIPLCITYPFWPLLSSSLMLCCLLLCLLLLPSPSLLSSSCLQAIRMWIHFILYFFLSMTFSSLVLRVSWGAANLQALETPQDHRYLLGYRVYNPLLWFILGHHCEYPHVSFDEPHRGHKKIILSISMLARVSNWSVGLEIRAQNRERATQGS